MCVYVDDWVDQYCLCWVCVQLIDCIVCGIDWSIEVGGQLCSYVVVGGKVYDCYIVSFQVVVCGLVVYDLQCMLGIGQCCLVVFVWLWQVVVKYEQGEVCLLYLVWYQCVVFFVDYYLLVVVVWNDQYCLFVWMWWCVYDYVWCIDFVYELVWMGWIGVVFNYLCFLCWSVLVRYLVVWLQWQVFVCYFFGKLLVVVQWDVGGMCWGKC